MPDPEQAACLLETASSREADLRRHPRYLTVDGGSLRLAVRPEFRGRRALLLDVSAGGIGFLLEDTLEPGTVLAFDLQGPDGKPAMARIARVRHSRPQPIPPDAPWLAPTPAFSRIFRGLFGLQAAPKGQAWLVGCEFDQPLSADELKQLLEQLSNVGSMTS